MNVIFHYNFVFFVGTLSCLVVQFWAVKIIRSINLVHKRDSFGKNVLQYKSLLSKVQKHMGALGIFPQSHHFILHLGEKTGRKFEGKNVQNGCYNSSALYFYSSSIGWMIQSRRLKVIPLEYG